MAGIEGKAKGKGGMYYGTYPGVGHNTIPQSKMPRHLVVKFLKSESPFLRVLI